jgi:ABC-type molybdate transport system substrate-binding protein
MGPMPLSWRSRSAFANAAIVRNAKWFTRRFVALATSAILSIGMPAGARADGAPATFHAPPWSVRDPQQFDFTVPGLDDVPDLHGSPSDADLVIFAAGNQFMVMPDLIRAFRAAHPEIHRIFYETLPPGIEARQLERGSIEFGNLVIDVRPDVLMSGLRRMKIEQRAGIVADYTAYATNQLAIMVPAGNPKHVASLVDLGRDDVRVSMPNPAWEGVAMQIEASYVKAGGDSLDAKIMKTKVAAGSTILTHIHHRETALNLLGGKADAGPVWLSEALYQKKIGNPIDYVAIPAAQNATAIYVDAIVRDAPHAAAARAFYDFVSSPAAAAIYRSYGFTPPPSKGS